MTKSQAQIREEWAIPWRPGRSLTNMRSQCPKGSYVVNGEESVKTPSRVSASEGVRYAAIGVSETHLTAGGRAAGTRGVNRRSATRTAAASLTRP